MARAPIEIGIASETKAFRQGIESGVIEPLDDAEEALDKLGRSDGPEGLERGLKDAQKQTERLGDETQEVARAIERDFKDSYRAVGNSADEGFDKAKAGAEDFKQEANSTAREAAASFDGSAESIGEAFQEISANAFAGFGPAGAVAGLAAAAGIGVAIEAIGAAGEEQEKTNERVAEWADAYVEAGDRVLSAGVRAARFQEIITDPEKFAEAERNAKNWGTGVETAIAAMAGDAGAIQDVTTALDLQSEAARRAAEAAQQQAADNGGQMMILTQQEQAYLDGAAALGKLTGEMEAGADRAALLSEYYYGVVNSAKGATKEVDEFGNELYTLPDGTEVLVSADTGQASANVSAFKGDVDGIKESVTTTVKFIADTSAADAARRKVQEQIRVGVDVYVRPGQVYWE